MIPARETIYNGIKMRSRTEARYAASLDRRTRRVPGSSWSYEPRAYANVEGQYLPDFELSDGFDTALIEVKPTEEQARSAIERMRIAHSSDPTLHLLATWLDQEAISYGEPEDWSWRYVTVPGNRAGIEAWSRWFQHHQATVERPESDVFVVIDDRADQKAELIGVDARLLRDLVALVIWPEPLDDLWDDLAKGRDRSDHPAIRRAAEVRRTSGIWTCLGHDRSLGPRLIEVSAAGEVTDRYHGQSWACGPLWL